MTSVDRSQIWDVAIIGGGVAGLSAALMLGRARRKVVVIDHLLPRNRFASHMHGVLGHENTPPMTLIRQGREEAAQYGVQFLTGAVQSVDDSAGPDRLAISLTDDGDPLTARAVIVATGITDVLPDIPGLAERWGRSVLHCPYCHGWEVADQRLAVLATSPAGIHQAQLIRQWSDDVTLFTADQITVDDEMATRLAARGVRIIDLPVVEVLGHDDHVTGIRTADGRVTDIDAIFTAGAPYPHDDFLAHLDLGRSELPYASATFLTTDHTGQTSHPRIWAVGNIVNPMANVPMAMSSGAFAGSYVNGVLIDDEFTTASTQYSGSAGSHTTADQRGHHD